MHSLRILSVSLNFSESNTRIELFSSKVIDTAIFSAILNLNIPSLPTYPPTHSLQPIHPSIHAHIISLNLRKRINSSLWVALARVYLLKILLRVVYIEYWANLVEDEGCEAGGRGGGK